MEAPWDYSHPTYVPLGTVFDVVTVAGACDWTGATVAPNWDERIQVRLHEHGMSVTIVPEPGSVVLLAALTLAAALFVGGPSFLRPRFLS